MPRDAVAHVTVYSCNGDGEELVGVGPSNTHFQPNPLGSGLLVNLTPWHTDRQLQLLLSISVNIRLLP